MLNIYETPTSIVAGIVKGDRDAERALVQRYSKVLGFILERRTQDKFSAEDLRQDTFLIVLEKLRKEPLDDPAKLGAYLQNTAIKLHIGEVRKLTRRKTTVDTELLSSLEGDEKDQCAELARLRARTSVRVLIEEMDNQRDRQILTKYYVHDHDKEMICEELNLTLRHFDRVISRARKRFKRLIKDDNSLIDEVLS